MSWTLEEAVTQLENVASVPAKQRHTNVADLAKNIASLAYESGIPIELVARLIKVIVKSKHLDQTTVTTLIKNLYPSGRVPSNIVARIICSLGPSKSKPSPATQGLLLRWLILVYDRLENQSYLSKVYGILFDNLDMISLRRSLCHLLSLITRRKHVKPFRIWALLELIRNTGGDERELLGFLRVFKSYYPDIIVDDSAATRRRATYFFKHPDPEWSSHLEMLQDKATTSEDSARESFQVVRRGVVKRSRVEVVIPEMQTSRVPPGFKSLEEIRSVGHFVRTLDKIELPNQIASALTDPVTQKYLLLVKDKQALQRMESWLASFFDDELDRIRVGDEESSEYLGYVLEVLVGYVRFTKEIPRVLDSLLRTYLPMWNGMDNRAAILGILEYLPILDYQILYENYLSPLENAILDNTVGSKISLLQYYSAIIRRWGCMVRSISSPTPLPALTHIISRAELLCLALLESHPGSEEGEEGEEAPTQSSHLCIVGFYLQLAQLFAYASTNAGIRLTTPLPQTVYIISFTPVICHISLISDVLATYKTALEQSLNSTTLSKGSSNRLYAEEAVAQFNGHVLDVCNLLWRNRGLNSDEPNALGCLIPRETVKLLSEYTQELSEYLVRRDKHGGKFGLKLPSMFSLSHNAALSGVSAACFKGIESDEAEESGQSIPARLAWPATQKVLNALNKAGGVQVEWKDYRLKMLSWLDEHGAYGIGRLMRSSMTTLRSG